MSLARTILYAVVVIALLASCGTVSYKDGEYIAQSAEFEASGWKDVVEVTIKNGKIEKINWDAIYKDESIPIKKKQYSKSGLYGMLAAGAIDEWYDQATAAEKFVMENGVDALNVNEDGHTDAVTGCTIKVSAFEKLFKECIEKAEK